jgi:hypothetical protein
MLKVFIPFVFTFSFILVNADTQISWSNGGSGGVLDESGSPVNLDSVFVLYYSADSTINPIDPFGSLVGSSGNDEVLLVARNITEQGFLEASDLPLNSFTQYFGSGVGEHVGGQLYSRIFNWQVASIDSENESTWNMTIPDNTYYHETPLFGPSLEANTSTPPSPLPVYYNDTGNGGITPVMVSQFVSIPEPTTIAILLMGIVGVIGFRKHLRK